MFINVYNVYCEWSVGRPGDPGVTFVFNESNPDHIFTVIYAVFYIQTDISSLVSTQNVALLYR